MKLWMRQWLTSTAVFVLYLGLMWQSGFFGRDADGPGFWWMLGITAATVSALIVLWFKGRAGGRATPPTQDGTPR